MLWFSARTLRERELVTTCWILNWTVVRPFYLDLCWPCGFISVDLLPEEAGKFQVNRFVSIFGNLFKSWGIQHCLCYDHTTSQNCKIYCPLREFTLSKSVRIIALLWHLFDVFNCCFCNLCVRRKVFKLPSRLATLSTYLPDLIACNCAWVAPSWESRINDFVMIIMAFKFWENPIEWI